MEIFIRVKEIGSVEEFCYLGSVLNRGSIEKEIVTRVPNAQENLGTK